MSYFSEQYEALRYPVAAGERLGFREAQRGALFAVGAHFAQRNDPAIVTMPTGSGKTAVLQACPFLLQAKRALVLTPSRLVREQIAADFKNLGVLRRIGALDVGAPPPAIFTTEVRVTTAEQWEALRAYDVVVATVPSVSPKIADVAPPPEDLFDLVLVDEAHHSPAATWTAILDTFSGARRVLFTATPFRRDELEIKGRFVYTYDLRKAYHDGVFGHVDFEPVTSIGADGEDAAIAKAAEAKLEADRSSGYEHLLMVRTDTRVRAKELEDIYRQHTSLRLKRIQGDHSLSHVRKVLDQLSSGELDGIICVNMLGEGFDLPNLKVAAVHTPHKSLAVTLQFIGRFARTAGRNLGKATFVAVRSGVAVEAEKLYRSGAVWSEIVPNLSEARLRRETEAREVVESFDIEVPSVPMLADLSLYTLSPYAHVKVFRLREPLDVSKQPDFGPTMPIVFGKVSEVHRAAVYITREATQVPWAGDDRLTDVRYDLFVFYYDVAASLLFICASRRADGLYRRVAQDLCGYDPRILPLSTLNRALRGLDQARFFNVGMRNRQFSSLTESYRQIAGSRADGAIQPDDARLFHRGHCFGTAVEEGRPTTIGLSSASKIWSNATYQLAGLLGWCAKLARKINTSGKPITGSNLDLLDMGEEVDSIPADVIYADWDKDIYIDPPFAVFDHGSREQIVSLTEFDLIVDPSRSDDRHVGLRLEGYGLKIELIFDVTGGPYFALASENEPEIILQRGRTRIDLIDYLNEHPLSFFMADLSRLCGSEHFAAPSGLFQPFDSAAIEAIDWNAAGVNPKVEFGTCGAGLTSIQDHLAQQLAAGDDDVVYWDHGSGEAADFIGFKQIDGKVAVRLYHCKGAGGAKAGNRVDDAYEVCGQAVKAAIWCELPRLIERLIGRSERGSGMAQFVVGDAHTLQALANARPASFEMIIVQPGFTRGRLEPHIGELLAAANHHIIRAGHMPLRVIGSD